MKVKRKRKVEEFDLGGEHENRRSKGSVEEDRLPSACYYRWGVKIYIKRTST